MSIEIQYNKNMEMCRVCVLPESNLIALDELFVFNYNLLTNLNVKLDDGLPQYCCQRCSDAVKYFIDFREKSIEREHTLKDVIKAIKPDKDSTQQLNEAVNKDIKQEVKIEEHDDFDCANDNISYEHLAYEDENFNVKKENQEKTIKFKTKLKQEKVTKRQKLQRKVKSPEFLQNRKKDKSSGVVTVRKRHVRTVKEETCEDTLLLCGICKENFHEAKELESHLEKHKTSQHCSICYEKVVSWPQLFGHRIQHLPEEQRRCHLCKKKYQSACTLEFHYLNLHNDEDFAKILRCNICTNTFNQPRQMRRHLISQHSDIRYYCDYCSKGYANKSSLKNHIKTHHTETTKFACDVCEYISKSYGGLRTHKIKKHAVFSISCKKCHRLFVCQERFDKHSCKEKITICPICGMKRVGGTKQLQRHLESHKPTGRYKCDRCPATYKTSYALKTHIDQHNGNRTKKCEYCPATFFYGSVLIKHRRTHTGEKPYVCKVCSKSFTGNNNLKVHMRVHGEFLINKKNKEED